MNDVATAEALFRAYFWPLYPPDVQADLAAARAADANPAQNPSILGHLDDAARIFAAHARDLLGADHDLALDLSDASVHRLSAAITRPLRDTWASHGAPGSPDSELFNVIVHGAAYVGACVVRNHGGVWGVRRPLWESVVRLVSRAGEGDLALFQWWLKSLSDESLDRGITLADRYRAYVENPCAKPEDLPVIAAADRRLPRLVRPSYDILYKWLKSHLPEMRDVGEHFPSPERWADFAFASVEALLVGGGRMLVLAGANAHGLHMMWLTSTGFEKSAFFPCDAFPEPKVAVDGDKLRAIVSADGKTVAHEMLWWGP
jgi:hypothetical protein